MNIAFRGKITNLILLSFSSYLSLFLGSLFLDLNHNIKKYNNLNEPQLAEFKRRKYIDIPEREKAKKLNYKFLMYPNFLANKRDTFKIFNNLNAYPLANQPNSKTYYCNEGYGLIKYKSDRFGFRNNDKDWDKKIDNFLIGDSFVHGACVEEENTISSRLNQFTGKNNINLGTSRNGIDDYFALLKFQLELKQRKSIQGKTIIFFYANDLNSSQKLSNELANKFIPRNIFLNDSSLELNNNYLSAYTKSRKKLSDIIANNDKKISYYIINSLKFSSIRKLIRELRSNKEITNNFSCDINIDKEMYELANYISEIQKSSNSSYLAAYIPSSSYWRPSCKQNKYKLILKEIFEDRKITFIDFSKIIDINNKNDFSPIGPHLSRSGYFKVSKYLAQIMYGIN